MHEYVGRCACGRVEVRLRSARAPGAFAPRSDAPTCSFCRAHDGVWISDPRGELIVNAAPTRVATFASNAVQFHRCAACDELVYATFEEVAVVRVGVFAELRGATAAVVTTNFDDEAPEAAGTRRRASWTPLRRP